MNYKVISVILVLALATLASVSVYPFLPSRLPGRRLRII